MSTKEQCGRPQKASTRKKIAKSLMGSKNPAYKDGRRSYRRIAGAKKGEHVHHRDGNSKNNAKSNLGKFKEKGPSRSAHEKKHDRAKNMQDKSGRGRKKVPRGYKAKRLKKS